MQDRSLAPLRPRGGERPHARAHDVRDGLERRGELELRVEKGRTAEWPRLEDETHIMTAGSTRPVMDAIRLAQVELVKWLVADYGFDKWEALQVVSQAMTMRIGNVVDPMYTVVAKFPKSCLPS